MSTFQDYHLVAIAEGQIIGYINGIVKEGDIDRIFEKQEKYLMIENLYVKSENRNNKIGGMLPDQILQNARSNGIIKYVVATETKDMDSILRFYEKHGFKLFFVQLFRTDVE